MTFDNAFGDRIERIPIDFDKFLLSLGHEFLMCAWFYFRIAPRTNAPIYG